MKLEDLVVYQLAMEIGDEIYFQIENWDSFAKRTTGKQLLESADSIAANISEGYCRFFYKENRQFQYYSRGSQTETKTWLTKARNRKQISEEKYTEFIAKLDELGKRHNNYIKSIGVNPND
jgi:four helix bundle protein